MTPTLELLEPRWLPCTPAQVLDIINVVNAGQYTEQADINADGMVSPLDVLLAINEANRRAGGWGPGEINIQPNGGKSSLWFSPCGESLGLLVLAQDVRDPAAVQVQISGTAYQPVAVGTLGRFHSIEFEVWGRGREWLKVLGEIEDELLTVIVG